MFVWSSASTSKPIFQKELRKKSEKKDFCLLKIVAACGIVCFAVKFGVYVNVIRKEKGRAKNKRKQ